MTIDSRAKPKKLLVEGGDDMRVIVHLMEANGVDWPKGQEPVHIAPQNGFEEIIKRGAIEAELKASGLETLGIVVDANSSAEQRWAALRICCVAFHPAIPDQLPPAGVIVDSEKSPRLGLWIMPDNRSEGMLETFLRCLVPNGTDDPLLEHAERSRDEAKKLEASYKEVHADKALIHTWLAWQDPPGAQLHEAVFQKTLDPKSPHGKPFVKWFRELFGL